jgi:subtilisin family serine protease
MKFKMSTLLSRRGSSFLAASALAAVVTAAFPVAAVNAEPSISRLLPILDETETLDTKVTDRRSKMSFASYSDFQANKRALAERDGKLQASPEAGREFDVLNVEFKTVAARRALFTDLKRSNLKDTYVLSATDRFADIFSAGDAPWDALVANPNVVRVEYDTGVTTPPPPKVNPAPTETLGEPESIVRGGHMGLTGKGVTIAILDTGVDFRHPDFITYDAQGRPTSRIKYIWDTSTPYVEGRGMKSPVLFPNGSSIGTLYTQAHLTAELRAAQQTIPPTDLDGHGTACASIAAGNGNADKRPKGLKRGDVVGVAPEADIVGVRFGYDGGFENVFTLTAAAEWLDKIAGTSPLILSGSFGGQYTGHDGHTIRERHLNARFPLTKPGRAIVFAAGNDGDSNMHATVKFDTNAKAIRWNATGPARLHFFFDNADVIEVVGSATTAIAGKMSNEVNPITGQRQATLNVNAGPGSIQFRNPAGKATEVHAYMLGRTRGNTFLAPERTYSHLVGSPGAMENAITVGSYDWNDDFASGPLPQLAPCLGTDGKQLNVRIGWLSCYSSPGPNRSVQGKTVTKPEIVAPGQYYASANARDLKGGTPNEYAEVDPTGMYRLMNGTSAATPYTSGVIALMLQKRPRLTLGQIKTQLVSRANKTGLNPFVNALPNKDWGYGKLNLASVDAILKGI